jgi:hypothetical protein
MQPLRQALRFDAYLAQLPHRLAQVALVYYGRALMVALPQLALQKKLLS